MPTTEVSRGTSNLSRKNSAVLIPTGKDQNQEECISGIGIGPSRSASASILMSSLTPAFNAICESQSVLVGGYRSASVQLEVELVERLNEIGRSNVRTTDFLSINHGSHLPSTYLVARENIVTYASMSVCVGQHCSAR
ncbi:unnamed protein product [Phytophthora fragariaefolia]|uniref:Unnamed protein product n=1 Tax=Phytophthora fragariaefolia TaxID=1490495 RepID=A0A9W6XDY5_9STRA|nr:unnamed protein product [Phytophthora fragariaefolia]